jgi:hypothetical protein
MPLAGHQEPSSYPSALKAWPMHSSRGVCFIALVTLGWFKLGSNDVLLRRWSLLQETVSPAKKVKKEEKREREWKKLKQLLRNR